MCLKNIWTSELTNILFCGFPYDINHHTERTRTEVECDDGF